MKESQLISVRLAKAFLLIMALILLVFIVCYFGMDAPSESYNEFTSPYPPLSLRDKLLIISLAGFALAIPFSCALNAVAFYVNRDIVRLGWVLQTTLIIALIGFLATPTVLFLDENVRVEIFAAVAAIPVSMWLISCFFLFRLESKEKKIIPDDTSL